MKREDASSDLIAHVVESIGAAVEVADPFRHLQFQGFFPPDLYAAMLAAMPADQAYRPMSGRAREARRPDGSPTRTKIHLLPEFTDPMPPAQREVWGAVGSALCSRAVRAALMRRLAAGLEKRFGADHAAVGMYPIPILTRDVPGYRIGIHPDTRHKAMTVQLYLPRDESIGHVGTVFHRRVPSGGYERVCQMPFIPNAGYAFAVGTDTYHSADVLGPEVVTRDSIILTYYVDQTGWQKVQNRARRAGNLVASRAGLHRIARRLR
jgi:hypothetical protein